MGVGACARHPIMSLEKESPCLILPRWPRSWLGWRRRWQNKLIGVIASSLGAKVATQSR
jgi:hypothetical protein